MTRILWHLGNTTVRSPFRLRDGLVALSGSSLEGALHGREQEKQFRNLLGNMGIVELGDDKTFSVGRKWRSALSQLGFLIPELPSKLGIHQAELGAADTISENGKRLIQATTVPAMQECFLRALAAYQIPNPLENNYNYISFSPLKFTLAILTELESRTGDSKINFVEVGIFLLRSGGDISVSEIVDQILEFREARVNVGNKKAFDNKARQVRGVELNYAATTFNDYADTTIRYLKATGLVTARGRGIAIYEEKRTLIQELLIHDAVISDPLTYYKLLCHGAELPTDEISGAKHVLKDVYQRAKRVGIEVNDGVLLLEDVGRLNSERYRVEERLSQVYEEEYAKNQISQVEEILEYLDALDSNSRSRGDNNGINIPSSERPAYLEWALWRAFLAINHLTNKPYEARRFKIDQDFLPIGTAPGNGPDLIFEFESFVLVVEATLTENSRQEAAEGETVRRHVTDVMGLFPNKRTYGLFIARNINTNTAHTFRLGVWYTTQDKQVEFAIVPISLKQFRNMFTVLLTHSEDRIDLIREFLERCVSLRTQCDTPEWKKEIGDVVLNLT